MVLPFKPMCVAVYIPGISAEPGEIFRISVPPELPGATEIIKVSGISSKQDGGSNDTDWTHWAFGQEVLSLLGGEDVQATAGGHGLHPRARKETSGGQAGSPWDCAKGVGGWLAEKGSQSFRYLRSIRSGYYDGPAEGSVGSGRKTYTQDRPPTPMPRRLPAENESSSKPEENRSLLKSVSARYWGKITSSLGFGNRNTGDSVVGVKETGPREERKKKRPGKRSSAEHFTPVNIGYVSEDTTPWQVQQPTQPQSPSPKKPSPGRPATTLRRPSYEWSRTLSASRPQTEEELAAQERSEREATEQRNRLLASLWNQNKGQSSKEPSQKRPSSPKQSGPRPFDPQEVAKDGRGKVVYATSLNDPRARGLAQGIPQNTSAGPRSPKKSLEWRRETSIPKPRGPNGQQVPSSGATTRSAPPRQMRTISGHPLPSSLSAGVPAPKPQPPSGKSVPNFDYVCEGGKCTIKYAETIPEENLPK